MNNLPYKVETVGEQNCKKCEKKIRSGVLKIAIMMQSEDDDCQYPDWYHTKCFFKVRLPQTVAAFDGFFKLRYADQQSIKAQLLGNVENQSKEEEQRPKREKPKLPDFHIEYTRSERDACSGCKQMIRVPDIKIMYVVYTTDLTVENFSFGGKATWYHVPCFVRSRHDLGWLESAALLPGYKRLSEEDKELVKKQIPIIKRKFDKSSNQSDNPDLAELEKLIETQNNEYYAVYDKLAKHVSKKDQIEILKRNFQFIPETKNEILHHLTDTIYFGALNQLCGECSGNMCFNNTTYSCTTSLTWGKCGNDVTVPKRRGITIFDRKMREKYPFLPFISPVRTRALYPVQFEDENGTDLINALHKNPPLFNMEFVLIGKLKMSRKECENVIKKYGGRVVNGIHNKLAAVISNQEEVEKMGPKMIEARACNIQVISEEFLSKLESIDPFAYIIDHSLSSWGGNPYSRIEQSVVKSRRETVYYTKALPEKMTLKLNDNNTANDQSLVDAESGLQNEAHIYSGELNGHPFKYYAVLGLVDIQLNKNSYYRLQLLEANDLSKYWVFEKWGRISTVIGSKRLTNYPTLKEACTKFHALYFEKTGNNFGKYYIGLKNPNKFYHLQIDFGVKQTGAPKAFIKSQLNPQIYQLMELIFDTKHAKQMMFNCDIDLKQFPLGKIDPQQIYYAMTVLKNIAALITGNGTLGQLRNASNQFYTLIPHGFSIKRPPIIDSIDMVKAKNEMLESLLNANVIYGFLEGENGEKINPLDAIYAKMKTEINPIDKYSVEFRKICEIVRNTHGATHNQYTLEVVDIYKVKRQRENVRSRKYKTLDNHQMLWHGSKLMNFVSILSKGLRIAPKEAPSTGYMFGKGIYFADVVSKSANYCSTSYRDNLGLMLLCDVALGKTRNATYATNMEDLPNENEQSVKACGETFPTEYSTLDGVKVAVGGLQKANCPTSLKYNEYVVYSIDQVKMKYLVKLKFNYHR